MVARNLEARKRRRLQKAPAVLKSAGDDENVSDYKVGLSALLSPLAARISATIDWTAGDSTACLARQAGPGPRI
jgi:hypothetical protein